MSHVVNSYLYIASEFSKEYALVRRDQILLTFLED